MKKRILYIVFGILTLTLSAQVVTPPDSDSISTTPSGDGTYTIKDVEVLGTDKYSKTQIIRFTGLYPKKEIKIPGTDINTAIKKLWRTKLFSDVEVYVSSIEGSEVVLAFKLEPLPSLGKVEVEGIRKKKIEKILEENKLDKPGVKITDNLENDLKNSIIAHYRKKGYYDTKVYIKQKVNQENPSLQDLVVSIDKGEKIKISEININGNKEFKDSRLKRKMKNNKEKFFGRIWKKSKYNRNDFEEDLENVEKYMKSEGFRDARVKDFTLSRDAENQFVIDVDIHEGNRYYLGDVSFSGNSVFPSESLDKFLGYGTGDPYDAVGVEKKVKDPEGGDNDIFTLYQDRGYLFSNIQLIEKSVENDSINIEIRISEGEQASWNRITFNGNDVTHDHVVLRSLRTIPGELYSKSDFKRTFFELAGSGYFEPQEITYDIVPNPETNTVDLDWGLVHKGASQIQLQGGYGGNRFIGTLGLSFNNFSLKNLLKLKWNGIVPQGDGQTLSIQAQAGSNYQNYSISFIEPWISGKKPTSLSTSFFWTILRGASNSNLEILGANVALGKSLTIPDDYFRMSHGISYQLYRFENYPFPFGQEFLENGQSNTLSYVGSFGRYSAGPNPFFPTEGSEIEIYGKFTPPFSLFNNKDYDNVSLGEKFRWLEFYKIKAKAYWFHELLGKSVMRVGGEFGYLGYYNSEVGAPPFERFYLGGTGLTGNRFDGREIIPLRGYPDSSRDGGSSSTDITPFGGGTIYNKFIAELRYPITVSQSATIYGLGFFEAGNTWNDSGQYKPFELKRSAGFGVRIFMPAFGLLGFDFGYGFDPLLNKTSANGWETHFIFNQQL